MIHPNTFYYTLSTIPQVLITLISILVAVIFFRIRGLHSYLLGDGKTVLSRWGEVGYNLTGDNDKKQKDRLRDAIDRLNIYEIESVIISLSDKEKRDGFTIQSRPTGLQYTLIRYRQTKDLANKLRNQTKIVAFIAILTTTLCLICLGLVDSMLTQPYLPTIVLFTVIFLATLTLFATIRVLYLSFGKEILHETDRTKIP